MASTTVGVLFSVLLTNKCTLGKGAPTSKDCWKAVRMLCIDDWCCGRRHQGDDGAQAALLGGAHSHAAAQSSSAQRVSINSADDAAGNDAQQDMSRSRRVSDASDGSETTANEQQNTALVEELRLKTRECEVLRLRVMELERRLGRNQQEQVKPYSRSPQIGSE
jgi:hypothetical protein